MNKLCIPDRCIAGTHLTTNVQYPSGWCRATTHWRYKGFLVLFWLLRLCQTYSINVSHRLILIIILRKTRNISRNTIWRKTNVQVSALLSLVPETSPVHIFTRSLDRWRSAPCNEKHRDVQQLFARKGNAFSSRGEDFFEVQRFVRYKILLTTRQAILNHTWMKLNVY